MAFSSFRSGAFGAPGPQQRRTDAPPAPAPAPFPTSRMPPFPMYGNSAGQPNPAGDHSEELWQACAGPLVYVPKQGDRVWYFPQGHMEQVAASTQQGNVQSLPNNGLDSQILCRVMHRVLSAETDTDEVYAQISLLPEPPEAIGNSLDIKEESEPAPALGNGSLRLFTKILTASDTSTHGGFSVLRKHAEDCLPPLDMSQDTPSQDLVAKDLHGYPWKFRHTYRGHPRRHLLTTGWSVFVSNKRLMAGDAVIFLRGENGELRVGIRRAKRQQTAQQAVMSSHSMHMGVVATANHAIGTRTMFTVYYKPRLSLSSFLVPIEKLAKTVNVSLSVGLRFKMRFETEDASDRSCAGTITGIDDLDPVNWPNSKWRSLKVNWDENNNEWPERISPWEIELSVASPVVSQPTNVRNKRFRGAPPTPSVGGVNDFTALGPSRVANDNTYPSQIQRVLQGQEPRSVPHIWRGSPQTLQDSHYALHQIHIQQQQQQHSHQHPQQQPQPQPQQQQQSLISPNVASPLKLPSPRTAFYQPFAAIHESDTKLPVPSPRVHHSLGQGPMNGSVWTSVSNDMPSNWLLPLMPNASGQNTPAQSSFVMGNPPSSMVMQHQQHQQQQQHHHQQQHHAPLAYHSMSSFPLWETHKQEKPAAANAPLASPPATETGCKLFGISLTDTHTPGKANNRPQAPAPGDDNNVKEEAAVQQQQVNELPRPVKSDATSEPDKADPNAAESRQNTITRSLIKVIKAGSMGRGIDLSKFDSYPALLEGLENMFKMKGELTNPDKGWQVAYCDNEGDTMKVGDDPWPEFRRMVRKLRIIGPEEDQSLARQSSKSTDDHVDAPPA